MTYFDDLRLILSCRGLTAAAKLVLIYLYDKQGGNGHSWPSITTISNDCCISRQSVINSLKALENAGLLKTKTARRPSIKESNRYSVLLTSLKNRPVDDNQSKNLTRTSQNFRPEPVKILDSNVSINDSTNEPSVVFDAARRIYPGRKRKTSRAAGKKFTPPTLADIKTYVDAKGLSVDPKFFLDYFTESGWIDSRGNPVKNWKQKLLTWDSHRQKRQSQKTPTAETEDHEARYITDPETVERIHREVGLC